MFWTPDIAPEGAAVEVDRALWAVVAFPFGAVVGSFLNVVIWRLPRGESVVRPGSHCPHCNRPLAWFENIPLVSFLALRARCRTCGKPIRWRYFWIELLTATIFAALIWGYGPGLDGIAFCVFAAALIAAFAIDVEHYIIPDSVNTIALAAGIVRDVWGMAAGVAGHAPLWGWLPRSIAGAFVCALVFVAIQAMGLALFRRDAMGDGDVKLGRAIGAMLPLPLALVSFLFAVGIGAIIGGAVCVVRGRKAQGSREASGETEPATPPPPTPWKLFALGGLLYLTFADVVIELAHAARMPWATRFADWWDRQFPEEEGEEFIPSPTQVPFGPFMVVGAGLAVAFGQRTIDWYLGWAGLSGVV